MLSNGYLSLYFRYIYSNVPNKRYTLFQISEMIPKEIAFQLVELKEKSKTYSAIQRSYKIDEIRADVAKINDEIVGLVRNVDNILVDGLISKIEIEIWVEAMKDKSDFTEPNPMLVYEERQRVLERQRKIVEEQENQEIEKQRKLAEETKRELERQREIEKEKEKQRLEEIERQKKFEEEKAKREAEELQKRLEAQQKEKQEEIERQIRKAELEAQQKREEIDRQNKIDAEAARQKQIEIERKRQVAKEIAKKEAEERQKRLQAQRIQEFRNMCYNSFDEDINKLEKLIEEGLDINNINDFDCLQTSISCNKSLAFIKFLVDSGILVKNTHIDYCYANSKHIKNSASIISILENAINLDSEAFENVLKRTKFNVIGTISATCICIFFLFMPQILNREIDNFYYILDGIFTILFLFISISFIVDLRKRLKINNTNHLLDNQLPHPKQGGYERPNSQGKIGIAGSVKEFNHKEIKRRKLILWIVVTLISISIIALIYIYFKEIMGFFKILLIILLLPLLLPIILKKR